jgi:hypothetical protein
VSKGKNKILSVIIFRSEIYDAIRCNSITWKIHIFFSFRLNNEKMPFWVLRRPMVVVGLVKHQNPLQFIGKKRKKKKKEKKEWVW